MKRVTFVALLLLVWTLPAMAVIVPQRAYPVGTVLTDSLLWKASGAILGSAGVRNDTIVAGTLNDTSAQSYQISGAKWVAVTLVFSQMGANATDGHVAGNGCVVYAQVGPEPDGGLWVTYGTIASTLYDGVAADTCNWILRETDKYGKPDTLGMALLSGGTLRNLSGPDLQRSRSGGWLRFIIDPTGATNDTVQVKGVLTRVF